MDIQWDVLTICHLSRNKFWGEAEDQSYRSPRCTSTLLRTPAQTIIVDPALEPEEMGGLIDQRAGIAAESVDIVFLTHFHGDHRVGIEAFPDAAWYMDAEEIKFWQRELAPDSEGRALLERVQPVGDELIPGISVVATPGHTYYHTSLLFESEGDQVVIAADAAMTRAFFFNRDYYFNTVDTAAAVASIEKLAGIADVIVPGHDNYFLNDRSSGQ